MAKLQHGVHIFFLISLFPPKAMQILTTLSNMTLGEKNKH
jgi:hypothetical protein